MSISQEEHRLLYRLAQAYYLDGLTQQQIARRYDLSRPKVSRLLQKARDEGVVSFVLMPPDGRAADLERAVEQAYGLDEVVLTAVSDPDNPDLVAREIGVAAAECVLRGLSGKELLGLAWGRTLSSMVAALPYVSLPDLTVVQITGGLGPVGALEHSTELARRAAEKLGARLRLLPAPGIVSAVEAARALRNDYQIAEVLQTAAQADVAVVGLGVPTPDSLLLSDGKIITPTDLAALRAAGAAGDLALRYIDAAGNPLAVEMNERIVGLTLAQIQRIPRVVGLAGGSAKHAMIRAALRGGLLDVLVTDVATAERLMGEKEEGAACVEFSG